MNDYFLFFYVLPVNDDSKWFYLYEACDAQTLQAAIARRPISELSYLTVYTNTKKWLKVGVKLGTHFDVTYINHHLVSDSSVNALWRDAKAIFDSHIDFKSDFSKLTNAHFPEVTKNTPYYLNLVK